MVQMTGVGPMFGQFTHFKMFAPKAATTTRSSRYQSEVRRLYGVLETRLGAGAVSRRRRILDRRHRDLPVDAQS